MIGLSIGADEKLIKVLRNLVELVMWFRTNHLRT